MASGTSTYDFAGKRALVTGAGKGIGRATCIALAKCGAEVIGFSRTQSDLDSLKNEVPGIVTVCIDLSVVEEVKREVERHKPIHLLVNNAALGHLKKFLEITTEEYDRVMDVNLRSVLFLSQSVAKDMIDRGDGGSIVNVSSQAAQCALPDHTVYCASKAGLDMLTKMMGFELGPHKIRVNAVNPTVVMTAMAKLGGWTDPKKGGPMLNRIPLGRFAEVEDVVSPILFLLSDNSSMINCTTLPIDGGFLAC